MKMTPVGQQRVALVGGVVLWEEVCHWGVNFEVSNAQTRPCVSLFLLPVDLDVELSATSAALCLSVCHHDFHHGDNGLNF